MSQAFNHVPEGAVSRKLLNSRRALELAQAIKRYADAKLLVPPDWAEELAELFLWFASQGQEFAELGLRIKTQQIYEKLYNADINWNRRQVGTEITDLIADALKAPPVWELKQ